MNTLILRERPEREKDIACTWWQLPPHTLLPLEDGRSCLLLYNGQRGGSAGPDVRDAIVYFPPPAGEQKSVLPLEGASGCASLPTVRSSTPLSVEAEPSCRAIGEEARLVGDVEFHTRASDWFTHQHQSDPRYNRVILHVVLFLDSSPPTRRQDGVIVPTCSLLDLPQLPDETLAWPCQQSPLAAEARTETLLYAGLLRFSAKSQILRQSLQQSRPNPAFSTYDVCLLPELAEGLGYGRDRIFFRAVGLRLVGLPARIPEPMGRVARPTPLDARRLRILYTLSARWRQVGIWEILRHACQETQDVKTAIAALRAAFGPLSQARTDILVCNIVLPFAAAIADLEDRPALAARAYQIYLAYPGLVSNRVTRLMSTQLQLPEEPEQDCLQQGLHFIYASTCQAKRCQACLCGGQRL